MVHYAFSTLRDDCLIGFAVQTLLVSPKERTQIVDMFLTQDLFSNFDDFSCISSNSVLFHDLNVPVALYLHNQQQLI